MYRKHGCESAGGDGELVAVVVGGNTGESIGEPTDYRRVVDLRDTEIDDIAHHARVGNGGIGLRTGYQRRGIVVGSDR
jgi:hypothetical protein